MSETSDRTRVFAWDGVSFSVPADWNLSCYSYQNNVVTLRMEDDYMVRMETDWVRPASRPDLSRVRDRYARASEGLRQAAEAAEDIADLPPGWVASLYDMPGDRRLVTAFHLAPDGALFCFFKLHFENTGRRRPCETIGLIASTFRLHGEERVPWKFYDVSFNLRREFRLVNTSFVAGRKHLYFDWRMRRLHVWFFSLADLLLKDRRLEAWAAEFLNGFKGIRGPRFVEIPDGGIAAVRGAYPLGHFEEIGRWAFRYHVICARNPDRNQIVLAIFNYRKPRDLEMLRAEDLVSPGL